MDLGRTWIVFETGGKGEIEDDSIDGGRKKRGRNVGLVTETQTGRNEVLIVDHNFAKQYFDNQTEAQGN